MSDVVAGSCRAEPAEGCFRFYRQLTTLFYSRPDRLSRLAQLEKTGLGWTVPQTELNRITSIFLYAIPFASRKGPGEALRECRCRQEKAQQALSSCRGAWEPAQIRVWLHAGAVVDESIMGQALQDQAGLPAILALLDGGVVPSNRHLQIALGQHNPKILTALLNSGARPDEKLLEGANETQTNRLLRAGACPKNLDGSPRLQRAHNSTLRARYVQAAHCMDRPDKKTLLLSMVKSGECPAAAWMIHRALEAKPIDTKLIHELLKAGARATPYALARACNAEDGRLAELLLQHGAHPRQHLAELMVALLPANFVKKHFSVIFPLKGGAQVSQRALEMAVRFSSTAVIRLFVDRGASSDQRTLARVVLRPDCTTSLVEAFLSKQLTNGDTLFFHRFQRWATLWAPLVGAIIPFLQVVPSDQTLAVAVMHSRPDFVEALVEAQAPVTKPTQRLALRRPGVEADKVAALLLAQNPFKLCKRAVRLGTAELVKGLLSQLSGKLDPKRRRKLQELALLRPTQARGVPELFLGPECPTPPKELIYDACEKAPLSTISKIFGQRKITRCAIVRALRRQDADPKPALWLCSHRRKKIDWNLPDQAFLGLPHQPKRIRAFYKLMESLSANKGPLQQWQPNEGIIEITRFTCGQSLPFTTQALENPEKVHTDAQAIALAKACPSLVAVECSSRVTDTVLEVFAKHCTQLKSISIETCPRVTPKGIAALARGCSQLESLRLRASVALRPSVIVSRESSTVKEALLSEMSPRHWGMGLAQHLALNSALANLDLTDSSLGDGGTIQLSTALSRNRSLKFLKLAKNIIGNRGAEALGEALPKNNTLTALNLRDNYIGRKGATALAAGLAANHALTSLNLRGNTIGSEGGAALGKYLSGNSSLRILNLRDNNVGFRGAEELGAALTQTSSLAILKLRGNDVSSYGAQKLGEALGCNHSLTILDLADNNIRNAGAKALSLALSQNTSLTTLKLGWNTIQDAGALKLHTVLCQKNSSLTCLDLRHNRIRETINTIKENSRIQV